MAFSVKQLLIAIAVAAFGLVAMLSEYRPVLGKLFDLLTLGIMVAMAYGVWLSSGERRAFRVGFLCWALPYFFLFKKTFGVGITELINYVYRAATQPIVVTPPTTGFGGGGFGGGGAWTARYSNFTPVFHSMFLLLIGVIGGWVTVYFYRRRERMLANRPQ
jgi:hypothetical protein